MEVVLILLLLAGVPVVFLVAKQGAEKAERERRERWEFGRMAAGEPPVSPPRPGRPHAQPQPVDLNAAGVDELTRLPGVGVRAAERIVAERERGGPFASVEDLARVEGFDTARIAHVAPRATVGAPPPGTVG